MSTPIEALAQESDKQAEVWVDLRPKYLCHVSNFGNFLSSIGKIRKLYKTKLGYLQLQIMVEGKKRAVLAHRLVALGFLKYDEKRLYVNHINGVKSDNRAENLEYVSRSENHKHAFSIGLQTRTNTRMTEQDVKEIKSLFLEVPRIARTQIAKRYGVSSTVIYDIEKGKLWKTVSLESKALSGAGKGEGHE